MDRSDKVNSKLSASKMEAASLCPAFFQGNQLFPWIGDRSAADEGTIRHDNEENQVPLEDIDDDERRLCAYRCRQALEECRQKVFGTSLGFVVSREVRYWYDESWSGQLDYMETDGVTVFIADYKTLHGSHTPATKNIQLLAQAVLVLKNNPDIEDVYACLIEPFNKPTYTTVKYGKEYLLKKSKWLEEVVEEAYSNDPKQIPGSKQCKWCSALYVCSEAKKHINSCLQKMEDENE
ncbi:MAG: hypothetical protein CMC82_02580 [Flavobacteriaceae bacterium]|nr:hypothetical protein [Flavobacteriaceae bacterium]